MAISHSRLQTTPSWWTTTLSRVSNHLRTAIDPLRWKINHLDLSKTWIKISQGRLQVSPRQIKWMKNNMTEIRLLEIFNNNLRNCRRASKFKEIILLTEVLIPQLMLWCIQRMTTDPVWLTTPIMDNQWVSFRCIRTLWCGRTVLAQRTKAWNQTKILNQC